MRFYCEEKETVLNELKSSVEGLSQKEAQKRLEENGKNKLEAAKGKSLVQRFLEQLADPMIIILLEMAVLSADVKPVIDEPTALEVTCRKAENASYYFIFNFTNEVLPLPACFEGCTDLLTGATVSGQSLLKPYDTYLVCRAD